MANAVQTSFSHTYAGKEFLTELFYKPQEGSDDIFADYKVMQVADKSNLYIPGNLTKILKEYSGCGFSASGNLTISDRVISTEKCKVNLEQCEDAWDDTVFEEALRTGVDIDDLRGTIVEDIIRRKMIEAMRSDIGRMQWFNKNGHSDSDYAHYDGWLQLAFDTSANLGYVFNMGGDSSIETSSVDDTLVTDGALTAFRRIWTNQSKTLRSVPRQDKRLYVTATIMDNYLVSLEDTQNETGQARLEDGKLNITFRGVPVVEVMGWDTHLADSGNPQATKIGDNLIVLSTPDNLIVGSDITNPDNEIKTWYSEDNETLRFKAKLKLGAQILHPEFMSILY
jgi:hypothetical protein